MSGVPQIMPDTYVQGPPGGIAPEWQFSQGSSVVFQFGVPYRRKAGHRQNLLGVLEVTTISLVMTASSEASWFLPRSL